MKSNLNLERKIIDITQKQSLALLCFIIKALVVFKVNICLIS